MLEDALKSNDNSNRYFLEDTLDKDDPGLVIEENTIYEIDLECQYRQYNNR